MMDEEYVRRLLVAWTMLILLFGASQLMIGCGPSAAGVRAQGAHEVLNTVTDIADPAYGLAAEVCHSREQAIVNREGTTLEQDQASIRDIREKCSLVFDAFEALRLLQAQARSAIEAVRQNPDDGAYAAAMALVAQVTAQWDEIRTLLRRHSLIGERTP